LRVNPSALNAQLEKGLVSAYVLFGAEPLMLEEAADQIRTVARQVGVDEVRSMTAGVNLDWSELNANADSKTMTATGRLHLILTSPN
jgi:DNA polymerase-3 subunit delta